MDIQSQLTESASNVLVLISVVLGFNASKAPAAKLKASLRKWILGDLEARIKKLENTKGK